MEIYFSSHDILFGTRDEICRILNNVDVQHRIMMHGMGSRLLPLKLHSVIVQPRLKIYGVKFLHPVWQRLNIVSCDTSCDTVVVTRGSAHCI